MHKQPSVLIMGERSGVGEASTAPNGRVGAEWSGGTLDLAWRKLGDLMVIKFGLCNGSCSQRGSPIRRRVWGSVLIFARLSKVCLQICMRKKPGGYKDPLPLTRRQLERCRCDQPAPLPSHFFPPKPPRLPSRASPLSSPIPHSPSRAFHANKASSYRHQISIARCQPF